MPINTRSKKHMKIELNIKPYINTNPYNKHINLGMYKNLVSWIYHICELKYYSEIDKKFIYSCFNVVSILNETLNLPRSKFQLIAIVGMYHEMKTISFKEWSYFSDNAYTPEIIEKTYNKWKHLLENIKEYKDYIFTKHQDRFKPYKYKSESYEYQHKKYTEKCVSYNYKLKDEMLDIMLNPKTYLK